MKNAYTIQRRTCSKTIDVRVVPETDFIDEGKAELQLLNSYQRFHPMLDPSISSYQISLPDASSPVLKRAGKEGECMTFFHLSLYSFILPFWLEGARARVI